MRETSTSIESFVAEARKRLTRRLPDDKADAAIDEAVAHLFDRREQLTGSGMPADQAEQTAVAAFGDARSWAHGIVESAYVDSRTRLASNISVLAAGLLIITVPLPFVAHPHNAVVGLLGWIAIICAIVNPIASLRSRSFRLPAIAGIGIVATVIFSIYAGLTIIAIPSIGRTNTRGELVGVAGQQGNRILKLQNQLDTLELGMNTFAGTAQVGQIPTALKTTQGYVVPFPRAHVPVGVPFQIESPTRTPVVNGHSSMVTVPTLDEARRAWATDGPAWIDDLTQEKNMNAKMNADIARALNTGRKFDVHAAEQVAEFVLILTGLSMAIHLAAAALGRYLHRRRRRLTLA